jgi:hypothetical protein
MEHRQRDNAKIRDEMNKEMQQMEVYCVYARMAIMRYNRKVCWQEEYNISAYIHVRFCK